MNKDTQQPSNHPQKSALKTPQKWIRHIFERSPALVYVTNYDGIFLDINAAGIAMLGGGSREDFIGKVSIRSFYANQEDRARFQELVAEQGFIQEFETQFRRIGGTLFDVRISGSIRQTSVGKIIGYEGFIVDITDRKQAERALKESEEKYRTVVENSLSAILVHQDGRFKFANQRCADITGYGSPDELLGRYFWEFVHPEDRAVVKERGLMREKGQMTPEHYSFRILEKDGRTIRWAEMRATHAMYMGKPAVVANFIDVTKSKRAEEEIRQLSSRLVKVREEERKMFAADLHDEVGQILTAMHFELDALRKSLPPEAAGRGKRYEKLVRNVEMLADIIRKTTSHLRPDILDMMVLVPALSRHIEEFKCSQPGIHVDFKALGLKKRLSPEIELAVYRIVQESLTNIAKHARATAVGIILTYSHPQVILTVRDNGLGHPAADGSRRKRVHGEGIGLLTMRERAVSLGGSFDVSFAPGKGTTIRAEIPV